MNPTSDQVSAPALAAGLAPPPQLLQPHRPSTSCDRHPDERFTGFCPSCLCERLAVLDQSNNGGASSSSNAVKKLPAISAASLKAIFKPSASNGNGRIRPGFFPELRRTKSFSASKNDGFSGVFEPQRRSCDVRLRSSLWNLFNQDEQRHQPTREVAVSAVTGGGRGVHGGEVEVEPRKSSVREPVFETKEEGEAESDRETDHGGEEEHDGDDDSGGGYEIVNDSSEVTGEIGGEIVEEEEIQEEKEEKVGQDELKPIKDHIDLDSPAKKPSVRDFAGSFWSAASVFSKKLQKWRQKQKMKKQRNGGGSARLPVEKPIGRQLRDTQSEIADYGFGRRSCDTDPRFSLDAGRFSLDAGRFSVDIGRISLDDPRYSFDEPRASWDGYTIGRTTLFPPPRVPPPPSMLSVMEDAQVHRHVTRSDMQIPVEEPPPPAANPESNPFEPGGSVQTRDYYTDSSSRRRKSLDRSSSIRKTAAAVVAEMDEVKPVSNSKVSPATTMESYGNSVIDDWSMNTTETAMNGERNNNNNKKSKRWSKWSILGFIYKKSVNVNKYDDDEEEDEGYNKRNGTVERSWSESWSNGGLGFNNPKMMRSNSNVSWRKSNGGWLERNKSLKDKENGMLRFYLTPVNGNRRSSRVGGDGNGWEKTATRTNSNGHSMARTVKRLY